MRSTPNRPRRGAVTTEAALVLPVFLTLVVGMLDLGVGVFRFNTLSNASRHGARQAIVHGEHVLPGWNGGRWRPGTGSSPNVIDEVSTASVPAVDAVRPLLVNCPAAQTRVRYDWLDSNDEVGSRVRCTVTSQYQPLLTVVFGGSVIPLTSSSTMPIAH
jgi:hypothetical protein